MLIQKKVYKEQCNHGNTKDSTRLTQRTVLKGHTNKCTTRVTQRTLKQG